METQQHASSPAKTVKKHEQRGSPGALRLVLSLAILAAVGVLAVWRAGDVPGASVLIVAAVVGAYMAINIGANDVANNVGPAVGSGALTLAGAIVIAAVFEAGGALIAGGDVVSTIKNGIIDPDRVGEAESFIWLMLAALLAGALWLNIATALGAPVSTTHSIVGAVLGAGIAAGGWGVANWSTMGAIAASWVISPLFGGVIAAGFLYLIKRSVTYQADMREAARRVVPLLVAAMTWAFSAYLMWKRAPMRRPLGYAVATGLVVWAGASSLVMLMTQQNQGLPDVALTDLNERPVHLAELPGDRPTIVNLWASWCPPCIREMPVLEEAQQRYPGINVVFVNQGEHPQTIRQFLMEQNLALLNVFTDRHNHLGEAVGSRGLPTTLFYDADGNLVDSHIGELSRASLARGLERFDGRFLTAP